MKKRDQSIWENAGRLLCLQNAPVVYGLKRKERYRPKHKHGNNEGYIFIKEILNRRRNPIIAVMAVHQQQAHKQLEAGKSIIA